MRNWIKQKEDFCPFCHNVWAGALVFSYLQTKTYTKNSHDSQALKVGLNYTQPVEKEMATHSSILAWEILWIEESGGPQSMGPQESDVTECAHMHTLTRQKFVGPLSLHNLMSESYICVKGWGKERSLADEMTGNRRKWKHQRRKRSLVTVKISTPVMHFFFRKRPLSPRILWEILALYNQLLSRDMKSLFEPPFSEPLSHVPPSEWLTQPHSHCLIFTLILF